MNLINRLREEFAGPQPVPQVAIDRLATLAQPPQPMPQHEDFAEEALRVRQRYLDQVAQIEQLTAEADSWRNRAMIAEAEIARLEQRLAEQQRRSDATIAELMADCDQYRQTIAVLAAQFNSASKILLDGFAVIEGLDCLQAKISPALAKAIEDEPPLPGFIARGPATDAEREG